MMFSHTISRVARVPAVSLSSTPRPLAAVSASTSNVLNPGFRRSHQRRYSSSKPPVPPRDGSRPIDTQSGSQPAAKSVGHASGKNGGESRRRRGKGHGAGALKAKHEAFLNLPSVPSTQHLHPHDVHVASFFSIHRPMSVTSSVPLATSPEAFSTIFSKKSKPNGGDVIYTLSSAVRAIENIPDDPSGARSEGDVRSAVAQAFESDAENVHGVPVQDLQASVQEFARQLRPFNPPPAPVPFEDFAELKSPATESADTAAEADVEANADTAPVQRTYSTVLTIRESAHADGQKTYEAHTTPLHRIDNKDAPSSFDGEILQEEPGTPMPSVTELPSRFLDRMRIRQTRWEDARDRRAGLGVGGGDGTMHAISVRRQRKLKMKKHKHKKLLRRTRTLRRKLDKA